MEKRCYLCMQATKLVEHPERLRKYYIHCALDNHEHEPCHYCAAFELSPVKNLEADK